MAESATLAIIDAIISELTTGSRKIVDPFIPDFKAIGFQPGGSPPPRAGRLYISIDEDGVTSPGQAAQSELTELFGISVWVSIRSGQESPDKKANLYRLASKQLEHISRQIINCIHGSQQLRGVAVANLPVGDAPFQIPLYLESRSKDQLKDSGWSGESHDMAAGWIVRQLKFRGMRRITLLNSIL